MGGSQDKAMALQSKYHLAAPNQPRDQANNIFGIRLQRGKRELPNCQNLAYYLQTGSAVELF
jgi:hypothetical protein